MERIRGCRTPLLINLEYIYISCNIRTMERIRGCRTPLLINLEYIYHVILDPWRELEDV